MLVGLRYGAVEWFQEPSQLLNRACGRRFSPKLPNPLGLGAYLEKVEDMSLPGVKRHPFGQAFRVLQALEFPPKAYCRAPRCVTCGTPKQSNLKC